MKLISKARVELGSNGMLVKFPAIYETNNINDFEFLPSNRPIMPSHVRNMFDSVADLGVLGDIVAARCGNRNFVVDRQHLMKAIELFGGITFRFKLIEAETEEEVFRIVTIMNTTQKRFSFKNFIHGWAIFKPEYEILIRYGKKYKIVDTVLASILTGQTISAAKATIKNGDFKVTDFERVNTILNIIYNFTSTSGLKLERYGSEGIYEFVTKVGLENYLNKQDVFIEQVKKYVTDKGLKNTTFGNTRTYINLFNLIWNRVQ